MSAVAAQATPPRWTPGQWNISDREFNLLRELIKSKAGIHLNESKKALLVGRLTRRLRELGLAGFREYYDLVVSDAGSEELLRMLDRISTNKTEFFREVRHFEFLERVLVPRWKAEAMTGAREKSVRVWSAACSTGEEPYSIAMSLLHALGLESHWRIEVLASDIARDVLDVAKKGIYPLTRSSEIPRQLLVNYMRKGSGPSEGFMAAGPEIRERVRFERINLLDPGVAVSGKFDVIFCRNVLIYFEQDTKESVIERLAGYLKSDGHLIVGHAESLHNMKNRYRSVAPAVYQAGTITMKKGA